MTHVVWLTGISGSGKTTLGERLFSHLSNILPSVEYLDGDQIRAFFEGDLGYSPKDRSFNVRRVAFASHLLSKNGVFTIVANIAPYYEDRDFIRSKLGSRYIQIYLNSSIQTVSKRDVQGHYKKFNEGKLENLIGLDDRYDVPRNPDLAINTNTEDIDTSHTKILDLLKTKGIL